MPLLDRDGETHDAWTLADGAAIDNLAQALVPWDALEEALRRQAPDQRIGVLIPNALPVNAISEALPRLGLIAIAFPAYSDGRGFSLARRLRRLGFKGRLRATGPLIPDQFAYALSCGFDEIELPAANAARQPVTQWLDALPRITATYQRGYGASRNILDQRRAARAAAAI